MTPRTFTTDNPTEAILLEQAQALIQELVQVGDQAPDGQVLGRMEGLLLDRGRDFLRRALATAAQAHAAVAEKKGRRPGRATVVNDGTTKADPTARC